MAGLLNMSSVPLKATNDAVRIAFLLFLNKRDLYAIDHGFYLFEGDSVSIEEGHKA
jgi:hypothetical protein